MSFKSTILDEATKERVSTEKRRRGLRVSVFQLQEVMEKKSEKKIKKSNPQSVMIAQ